MSEHKILKRRKPLRLVRTVLVERAQAILVNDLAWRFLPQHYRNALSVFLGLYHNATALNETERLQEFLDWITGELLRLALDRSKGRDEDTL